MSSKPTLGQVLTVKGLDTNGNFVPPDSRHNIYDTVNVTIPGIYGSTDDSTGTFALILIIYINGPNNADFVGEEVFWDLSTKYTPQLIFDSVTQTYSFTIKYSDLIKIYYDNTTPPPQPYTNSVNMNGARYNLNNPPLLYFSTQEYKAWSENFYFLPRDLYTLIGNAPGTGYTLQSTTTQYDPKWTKDLIVDSITTNNSNNTISLGDTETIINLNTNKININTLAINKNDIIAITNNSGISYKSIAPVGMVQPFVLNTSNIVIPTGWLLCDGSLKLKDDYLTLYNTIEYSFGGSGDNFALPDLRDKYLRSYNGGEKGVGDNNYGGKTLNSYSDSTIKGHTHNINLSAEEYKTGGNKNTIMEVQFKQTGAVSSTGVKNCEIHPYNIVLAYCIKY